MLVHLDFVRGRSVPVQLLDGVRMLVQFHFVFWTEATVQFCDRMLVLVYRLFAGCVDVVM